MTRINVVPVKELKRQHLIAEYRELPRVFSIARKRADRTWPAPILGVPEEYTLGRGHVLFFIQQLTFLLIRYQLLIDEMRARGYQCRPVPLDRLAADIPAYMFGNYKPTRKALALNRARIKERLK